MSYHATPSQPLLPHDFSICLHGGATPQCAQTCYTLASHPSTQVAIRSNDACCQRLLTESHHVILPPVVTQLPHVGEINGGDGASRCPTVPPHCRPSGETVRRPASATTLSTSGSGSFTRRRCNMGNASSSSWNKWIPEPGDSLGLKDLESMIRIHQYQWLIVTYDWTYESSGYSPLDTFRVLEPLVTHF